MSDVNGNHKYANDQGFPGRLLFHYYQGLKKTAVSDPQNLNDFCIWIFTSGNTFQDVKGCAFLRSSTVLPFPIFLKSHTVLGIMLVN